MDVSHSIVDHITQEDSQEEQEDKLALVDSHEVVDYNDQEEQLLPVLGKEDSCDHNAEFGVICSFLSKFGEQLELSFNIEQLKTSLEDQSQLDEELVNLHVALLKKTRRYFVRDQWEKALIRFTAAYSYEDAYELESLGYVRTRPSIKLELLRRLLDAQFECNQKFKASINSSEATELRVAPTGRDVNGNTYWHEVDSRGNIRVFHEQPLDHQSWKAVCSNNDDLDRLIKDLEQSQGQLLKGEPILEPYNPLPDIFPEIFGDRTNQLKASTSPEENQDNNNNDAKKNSTTRLSKQKAVSLLKTVKEEEEENDQKPCNIKLRICLKQETRHDTIVQHTCILTDSAQENQKTLYQNNIIHDQSTIESQVGSTLEFIIGKVSSEFNIPDRLISPQIEEKPNIAKIADVKQEENHQLSLVTKPKPPKKRVTKKEKSKEESGPRRTSSRIQQIQMKKIAEQEEELKRLAELKAKKLQEERVIREDDDSKSGSYNGISSKRKLDLNGDESNDKKKRRKRKNGWNRGKDKKKLSWDRDDSDLSSTSSPTESNDDFDDDLDDSFKFENYDDEFACEEEETSVEPVIVKRARTARQNLNQDNSNKLEQSTIIEEDKPCRRCDKSNDPDWILLCDMCDEGYHTSCCIPPLMLIPDGDWYCPSCEHKMLLIKLKDIHYNNSLLVKVNEVKKKEIPKLKIISKAKEAPKLDDIDAANEYDNNITDELLQVSSGTEAGDDEDDDVTEADLSNASDSSMGEDEDLTEPDMSDETETDIDEDEDISDADFSNETETSIDELLDVSRHRRNSGSDSNSGVRKKKRKLKKRNSYESDDSDWQPSRPSRNASMKISYKESTDEEDLDFP